MQTTADIMAAVLEGAQVVTIPEVDSKLASPWSLQKKASSCVGLFMNPPLAWHKLGQQGQEHSC